MCCRPARHSFVEGDVSLENMLAMIDEVQSQVGFQALAKSTS